MGLTKGQEGTLGGGYDTDLDLLGIEICQSYQIIHFVQFIVCRLYHFKTLKTVI